MRQALTFKCQLADETVYVNCIELNWLMIAEPNNWIYYIDSDNCQGQCRKKELIFISVEGLTEF